VLVLHLSICIPFSRDVSADIFILHSKVWTQRFLQMEGKAKVTDKYNAMLEQNAPIDDWVEQFVIEIPRLETEEKFSPVFVWLACISCNSTDGPEDILRPV